MVDELMFGWAKGTVSGKCSLLYSFDDTVMEFSGFLNIPNGQSLPQPFMFSMNLTGWEVCNARKCRSY